MEDKSVATDGASRQLKAGSLGTIGVVFLVLATVTPLGAVVGVTPLAFILGTGIGVPGAWLLTAIVLALFAFGYTAMARDVKNAGAFYAYIARGIGRPFGISGAGIAVVAYNAVMISVVGVFGYFANAVFNEQLGIDIPWQVWDAALLAVILALGYLRIDLSAKVLGVALILEVGIITVLNVAILAESGFSGYTLDSFAPKNVFAGGIAPTLVFAFYTFIGFEATAIYSEEARDPARSVRRSTFIAVGILGLIYVFTSWSLIASYGANNVVGAAGEEPAGLIFGAAEASLGSWASILMQFLVLSSIFASALGLHSATARYFFALGREGILPRALGKVHPRHFSPYVAGFVQVVIAAVVVGAFALAGEDPYLQMVPALSGLGTLGVVILQAGAAVAAVTYFRRLRDRRWLTTAVLPGLGAAGLITAAILIITNYSALTGKEGGLVNQLPWLLLIVAVVGFLGALWMRSARPGQYQQLARALVEGDDEKVLDEAPVAAAGTIENAGVARST